MGISDQHVVEAARLFQERPFLLTARDSQIEPSGDWATWLILAGRGWGKTRTGAEWIHDQVLAGCRRLALVAPTAGDARDTMIEGVSGILETAPAGFEPIYEPSKRRITWPNGAIATAFSADRPDRLRGPNHEAAWADELAAWKYPQAAWDQLQFGLRIGKNPRCAVTTTPRPIPLIRDLVADQKTHITRGSTVENKENLSALAYAKLQKRYGGTRLGRQELDAEILDDTPGALWTRAMIDQAFTRKLPDLARIVVAIDPAVSSGEDADDTGIVIAGRDKNDRAYVLEDASVQGFSPNDWAARAVMKYKAHKADRILAEVNNGGELVETVIRVVDRNIPYTAVHASKGKIARAEPISALYEQGRVMHHGAFPELEDQMCTYVPGEKSPGRMDALVWAITELLMGTRVPETLSWSVPNL